MLLLLKRVIQNAFFLKQTVVSNLSFPLVPPSPILTMYFLKIVRQLYSENEAVINGFFYRNSVLDYITAACLVKT